MSKTDRTDPHWVKTRNTRDRRPWHFGCENDRASRRRFAGIDRIITQEWRWVEHHTQKIVFLPCTELEGCTERHRWVKEDNTQWRYELVTITETVRRYDTQPVQCDIDEPHHHGQRRHCQWTIDRIPYDNRDSTKHARQQFFHQPLRGKTKRQLKDAAHEYNAFGETWTDEQIGGNETFRNWWWE